MNRVLIAVPIVAVLAISGCVNPNLEDTGWFTCSKERPECPEGTSCINNKCVDQSSKTDLGPVKDARADKTPKTDLSVEDGVRDGHRPPEATLEDATLDGAHDGPPSDQGLDSPVSDGPPIDQEIDGPLPDGPLPDGPIPDGPQPDQPTIDLLVTPDQSLTDMPSVTPPLQPFDPSDLPLSTTSEHEGRPAVAFGQGNYLVVWDMGLLSQIHGAWIPAEGTASTIVTLDIAGGAGDRSSPSVSFDGSNFLVVWLENFTHIVGKRIDTNGAIVDATPLEFAQAPTISKWSPKVASGVNASLVVWLDKRNEVTTGVDIYGALVQLNGTLLLTSDIPIITAPDPQDAMNVAALSSGFLVVAENQGSAPWYVTGKTVSPAGVVGSNSLTISHASDYFRFPDVAADGSNFLVSFVHGNNDLAVSRVNASGTLIDTAPIMVHSSSWTPNFPTVTWSGKEYLVGWQEFNGSDQNILGKRISSSGQLIDALPNEITMATGDQQNPRAAGGQVNGASQYMVVWQDKRNFSTGGYDAYGIRLK